MASQYATLADLITRYNRRIITDISQRDDSDVGEINQVAVDTSLVQAAAEIDEYIGARYKLPLTAVSPQLIQISCEITRFYMETGVRVESAVEDYERCIKRLESFRDGNTNLGLGKDDKQPELNDDGAVVQSDALVWGRKDSKGFI